MHSTAKAWLAICLLGVGAAGCGSSSDDNPGGDNTGASGGDKETSDGSTSGSSPSSGTSGTSGATATSGSYGGATGEADAGYGSDASLGIDAGHGGVGTSHADAGAADAARGEDAGHADAEAPSGTVAAIPLKTQDGTYYTAQVTLGTQMFTMDIDTGSATAAVAGSSCTSCSSSGISMLYTPSSSATDQHKTSTSTYADGSSWSGEIYQDTAGLGYGTPNVQLKLVSIQAQNQFFGMSTFQGILGLGPSGLATQGTNAYLPQEFAAGVTSIVAFELCSSSGTMWLGGFDSTAATAAMQYTPLVTGRDSPYYGINVDDMAIGGKSLGLTTADFETPIVDTGTSLFYLPTTVFNALLTAINASSGYKAEFSTPLSAAGTGCVQGRGLTAATLDAQLPSMSVSLPNTSGGTDFVLTLTATQSYLFDAGGGTFCLAAGDGGAQQGGIFGDSFLASFVTVIDQVQNRVGFATDAGCSSALSRRVVDLSTWNPRHPRPRVPLRR